MSGHYIDEFKHNYCNNCENYQQLTNLDNKLYNSNKYYRSQYCRPSYFNQYVDNNCSRVYCLEFKYSGYCANNINNLSVTNNGDYALELKSGRLYQYSTSQSKYLLVDPQPTKYYYYCKKSKDDECGCVYYVKGANKCPLPRLLDNKKYNVIIDGNTNKLYQSNGCKYCFKCKLGSGTGGTGTTGSTGATLVQLIMLLLKH